MSDELLKKLVAGIDEALPEAAALRREIHADPRLSGEEGPTRDAFVAATGWLDWRDVAHTGAWARVGPRRGPAVGVRAELDALPIEESTGIEWESRNPGVMHACGHDVHMAALWRCSQQPATSTSPSASSRSCSPARRSLPQERATWCRRGCWRRNRWRPWSRPRPALRGARHRLHWSRRGQRRLRLLRDRRQGPTGPRRLPTHRHRPHPPPWPWSSPPVSGLSASNHRPDAPDGGVVQRGPQRHGAQHHRRRGDFAGAPSAPSPTQIGTCCTSRSRGRRRRWPPAAEPWPSARFVRGGPH